MYRGYCLLKSHLHVIGLSENDIFGGCAEDDKTLFYIIAIVLRLRTFDTCVSNIWRQEGICRQGIELYSITET